jgi:hypothetical protein
MSVAFSIWPRAGMIAVAVKTRWEIGEVGKHVKLQLQPACE